MRYNDHVKNNYEIDNINDKDKKNDDKNKDNNDRGELSKPSDPGFAAYLGMRTKSGQSRVTLKLEDCMNGTRVSTKVPRSSQSTPEAAPSFWSRSRISWHTVNFFLVSFVSSRGTSSSRVDRAAISLIKRFGPS